MKAQNHIILGFDLAAPGSEDYSVEAEWERSGDGKLTLKAIRELPKDDSIYLYNPDCDCSRCRKRRKKTTRYLVPPRYQHPYQHELLARIVLPQKKKTLLQRLKGFFK